MNELFMKECIRLGLLARENGESAVGSVVVMNGEIISRAIEASRAHHDITFHAEIEAIRKATALLGHQDLSECELYTTHEPCIMCSYVIRHTRIRSLIIGLKTGELGGTGLKYPILTDASIASWSRPPEIIFGFLEDEYKRLLQK